MGAFEHVISLLSFVYALAIAHLLSTAARLISARERVRFSWFHAYWMLNAFIVLIADWISYWEIRSVPSWSVVSILVVLVQSFADYMQAALVCPDIPQEGEIDLARFHVTHARRYIGAFAVTALVALGDNLYFGGYYDVDQFIRQNAAVVPFVAIAAFSALYRRRWVDVAAPVLLLGIWGYYMSELQGSLK